MRITDEIFQVGGGGLTSPEDAAVYLIRFESHGALVDAGCGRSVQRIMDHVRGCGLEPEQIEYLLITHCHYDHTGGARAVKDLTGCSVVAHEQDARFLEAGDDTVTAAKWYGSGLEPFHVDLKLRAPREQVELGNRVIEAVHTPGHSPGSVVYLTESLGMKVLFGQDVHGPLDDSLLSDGKAYRESLALLLTLDADILCEGHFGILRGKKEVEAFIKSFM
jgi:glyoxylase-like metal-dependent hydrolase (beta-lactamase superfamily II)